MRDSGRHAVASDEIGTDAKALKPRIPVRGNAFQAYFSAAKSNRKCDRDALRVVMGKIINREPLDQKHKNHKLQDEPDYKDCWECHTSNDWVLIYKLTDDEVIFIATGTHSDLF